MVTSHVPWSIVELLISPWSCRAGVLVVIVSMSSPEALLSGRCMAARGFSKSRVILNHCNDVAVLSLVKGMLGHA